MKVVLTGGKFNKIHKGHLWLLRKAKSLGSCLIVVLANDSHNKRSYALPAAKRKKLVAETKIPDKVIVGDPEDYFRVVQKFKPSVIVLGYDQRLPPKTGDRIKKMKINIVRLKKHGNYSSKNSQRK